jgi:transposase InsO family protein
MKLRNPLLVEDLRRRYFIQGWTHMEVRSYLASDFRLEVSVRTLKRWKHALRDRSWPGPTAPCPPAPGRRVSARIRARILHFRRETGWGRVLLKRVLSYAVSETTYRRLIKASGLSRGSKIEHHRIHWVKFERDHPDSLWQLDSWQLPDGSWVVDVLDDATRFCLGIRRLTHLTTEALTAYLDLIILVHGAPRELLTDNGSEHGGTSKLSVFDEWCRGHGIVHIRSRVHKPTTAGKVERFHQTVQRELPYCRYDLELFRYRYNHIRPHMSLGGRRPAEKYFDLQERLKPPSNKPREYWRG